MAKADFLNNLKTLKRYLKKEPSVLLAFLFGSFSKGFATQESDVDIGLYLKEKDKQNEIEFQITKILEKETDYIYLDEAPATLISNMFKTGIPLVVKDKKLYWQLYLSVSLEAEDFLKFARDYWEIYKRARSLVSEEEVRLLERMQFLQSELREVEEFKKLTFDEYRDDKSKRRNIERWAENILNATIDIAKIILASEKKRMPKTYEDALFYFAGLVGFNNEDSKRFSKFANLRNILAHEYLDILFSRIQKFIPGAPTFYEKIFTFLEEYLKKD